MDEFFIEDGVHRAVAARENGLSLIPAILYTPGLAPRAVWVRIDQLHSPRATVSRSDPRHNYPALKQAMGTPLGRSRIPPIQLQPLGLPGQPVTTPLGQVTVEA